MDEDYWKESMNEVLDHYGIELGDKTDDFIKDVMGVSEMEYEASGQMHIGNPKDSDLEEAKARIQELEAEVETANENFRKNVAMRRNCDPRDVTLGDNGHAEFRR